MYIEKYSCRFWIIAILNMNNIFKLKEQLSDQIDQRCFAESIFNQSALFLRVRPGNMNKVVEKLNQNQIHFQQIENLG